MELTATDHASLGLLLEMRDALIELVASNRTDASYADASAQVTPATGSVLAKIPAPGPGLYDVDVRLQILAGVAATDAGNVRLRAGNRVLIPVVVGFSGSGSPAPVTLRVKLGGEDDLIVDTVGAPTAGAVYVAALVATRVQRWRLDA
jgi:hypothetical protein